MADQLSKRRRRRKSRSKGSGTEQYRDKLKRRAPSLKVPLIVLAVFLVGALGFVTYYESQNMSSEPASTIVDGVDPLAEIRGGRATISSDEGDPNDLEEQIARGGVAADVEMRMRNDAAKTPRRDLFGSPEVEPEQRTTILPDLPAELGGTRPSRELQSDMPVVDPGEFSDDESIVTPGSAADSLRIQQVEPYSDPETNSSETFTNDAGITYGIPGGSE